MHDGEQLCLLAFLLKDFVGPLVRGKGGHIELFLLGEVSLMELDEQDEPDECGGEGEKSCGVYSDKAAPSANEKRDDKEDDTENQRRHSDAPGRY